MDNIKIIEINNQADERGDKYFIPVEAIDFIGDVKEMHYVSMRPGAIRGNHTHAGAKEMVVASYAGDWQCVWREEEGEELHVETMQGEGTVAVLIPAGIPHTFVNSGQKPVFLYCFSDRRHDPENPHTFPEELVK
jgi:dTDP-4-dehydrorhamnose 3,5-epimerase-like enzyme